MITRMRPFESTAIAPNGRTVAENFATWFLGSAVVTPRGQPLMVFHRTAADFTAFDTDRGDLGSHFGTAEQALALNMGMMRPGEATVPVYLALRNPIKLRDLGSFHADAVAPQLRKHGLLDAASAQRLHRLGDVGTVEERRGANREIKSILMVAGFDGVVYENKQEGNGKSWIAFCPEQVKSAIGNSGLFNADTPDMVDRSTVSRAPRRRP